MFAASALIRLRTRRCFNGVVPAPPPADVTTSSDDSSVTATWIVAAPPAAVFDYLRRPASHPQITGDGTVRRSLSGPDVLGLGDRFRMSMRLGIRYLISSKVVEFEQDRLIAWCHLGGHRWRWELRPEGDGATRLSETFDQSTSRASWLLRRAGYPQRHLRNVAASVANVAAHFSAS